MPGPPVLVTRRIPAAGLAKLEPWATVELWAGSEPPTPEQLRERLVSCEGLLCLLAGLRGEPLPYPIPAPGP
jgi:hypothetical protein